MRVRPIPGALNDCTNHNVLASLTLICSLSTPSILDVADSYMSLPPLSLDNPKYHQSSVATYSK